MSEVFDGYERQYCELSANLSRLASLLPSLSSADEYQKQLKDLNNGLVEAESLVRRMELEARSQSAAVKTALMVKIREYKADLGQLSKEVRRLPPTPSPTDSAAAPESAAAAAARAELLEAGGSGSRPGFDGMQAGGGQMMSAAVRATESTARLEASRRVLLETEDLGVSILEDLHQQRQTLLHARDTLHGVDDSIARARAILNSMARHLNRNKWVAALIAAILIIAIVVVIIVKTRSHGS